MDYVQTHKCFCNRCYLLRLRWDEAAGRSHFQRSTWDQKILLLLELGGSLAYFTLPSLFLNNVLCALSHS